MKEASAGSDDAVLQPGGVTLEEAVAALAASDAPFVSLLRSGDVEVELYRPVGADLQSPHDRDEIYVVLSGSGEFACGTELRRFAPGDVLVVPAFVEHRFLRFTADFQTWVIFFGPRKTPPPSAQA